MCIRDRSRRIPSLDSNLLEGVNKVTSHHLKQKSVAGFKMHPTICQEMDEPRTQANPTFEPFGKEDHGYASSDSSPALPRELVAESETESANSVIMPAMVTEATNIEEQLADMKATLDRLAKENLEKDAQIKRQSEQIATLMKKLEKRLFESSSKGSDGEESDKESNRSEDSDDERMKKKEPH